MTPNSTPSASRPDAAAATAPGPASDSSPRQKSAPVAPVPEGAEPARRRRKRKTKKKKGAQENDKYSVTRIFARTKEEVLAERRQAQEDAKVCVALRCVGHLPQRPACFAACTAQRIGSVCSLFWPPHRLSLAA